MKKCGQCVILVYVNYLCMFVILACGLVTKEIKLLIVTNDTCTLLKIFKGTLRILSLMAIQMHA